MCKLHINILYFRFFTRLTVLLSISEKSKRKLALGHVIVTFG